MKKFIALALILATIFTFCACSKGSETKVEYKTDVAVSDLSEQVSAVNDGWNFIAMDENYIAGAMKIDVSGYADYVVNINAFGTNVDEYGIFKAKDEASVAAVKADAENYLKFRLDTWMEEYMPEEKPKLEKAEVKVCGLYVMYAIVDDTSRADAFAAFENALKK